ncbi:hypothetical protein MGYG_05314 [Nannizzia gypsea CBS 118893]|uniref:Uncharacterized protein n=1 Tax=Arthroderma gypseum (strain ATCC MYA-4604 / CBS 118893) TaxID=535722 RepID=E4UVJ0_ARTGP|nr:hypothetical protein MGYG_05314 [Nannizzia gypsea CBS 118893]EFR02317.1 hypothetical protein MGYG_05314 [Nannizzia gypsea CBS 118893]
MEDTESELTRIDDPKHVVRHMLKSQYPWGWVVYRCTYSDEEAWQKMLHVLRNKVVETLKINDRMDLLPFHEMTIIEDNTKFDGATSHNIRDHFTTWVADTVMERMVTAPSEPEQREIRDPYKEDPGPEWIMGTRYNFCLFVDDICLESLEYMTFPVVKVLAKNFGARKPDNRDYTIYPGWEDGETNEGSEEVGWMYTHAMEIVSHYDELMETDFWYDTYSRPPSMRMSWGITPGSWRKTKVK